MQKALFLDQPGGPEMLKWRDAPMPEPGEGEIRIQHKAIGLNFIDIYHRTGHYPLPGYPAVLGMEGAGVVDAVGPGCEMFKPGDIAAYGTGPLGAYAQCRVLPERKAVPVPPGIPPELAAAVMLKGLTAHTLLRRVFMVNENHTILVHAAAGGVGLLLCQWAKHLGARVIGTAGSDAKAELARQHGCDEVILYNTESIQDRMRDLTDGMGVNAVYDAVGAATWQASLDCLMPFGILVSYGQASGPPPPIEVERLMAHGSLFLTRPSVLHYKENTQEYRVGAAELFDLLLGGALRVHVGQSYYLSDGAHAHKDMEARATTGSTILLP